MKKVRAHLLNNRIWMDFANGEHINKGKLKTEQDSLNAKVVFYK